MYGQQLHVTIVERGGNFLLDKSRLLPLQENKYHRTDTREVSRKQGLEESNERDPAKEEACVLRAEGNAALKAGRIDSAVEFYSRGLEKYPNDHVLYSNRSAAYLMSKRFQAALTDAQKCTELEPDWCKVLM